MKFFAALCLLTLINYSSFAQDLSGVLKEGDRLEVLPDEKAALAKFKEALKIQPSNLYALTKCSELCARIGGREKKNTKLRDEYYNTAIIYARTALRLYPESDLANVTMGIAVGKSILLKSGKEKISAAKELKAYAEKALKVNPNNFKAWSILGKWNFEVSNLSGLERGLAKIIYGGLPPASLKTAISCYEKAAALSPAYLYNYLELAKAYHRNKEHQKANRQLQTLLSFRNTTEDDPRMKAEAQELLKKWE
ncbi:MAG: hypothetical protein WKF88_11160 [Ferruginibacter sp.]